MSNLTQDWKDGKLLKGLYYVQFHNGEVKICGFYELCVFRFSVDTNEIKILAEVPDYTSWQNMKNVAAGEHQINKLLIRDREKSAQLLKDCHSAFCRNLVENEELTKKETITLLTKIEKTFKEIGVNNGKEAG